MTEIGNTIGFVRLMCTGAMEYYSYSANFIQHTEAEGEAWENPTTAQLAANRRIETVEAAHILDSTIKSINDTLKHSNDYVEVSSLLAVLAHLVQ